MEKRDGNILEQMRSDALKCFKAAIDSVNPYDAVKRALTLSGNIITVAAGGERYDFDLEKFDRIFLVGGGKAGAPMAAALEDTLGNRITEGLIVVKYGFTRNLLYTEIIEAGHPVPDEKGRAGAKRIMDILKKAGERDLVFSIISGGGSALLPLPVEGISFEHKQKITQMLLDCGAGIDEINCIRKHISATKGGQMARAAFPATTINLMLSDVVGDKMDVIASGPFVPDNSSFKDAWDIVTKYRLNDLIPHPIRDHLKAGVDKKIEETPKHGDEIFTRVFNLIIGSNMIALEAAEKEARRLGYSTLILSSMIEGETRDIANVHTAIAREVIKSGKPIAPPCSIISGGETTVTIRGNGKGGRNQEFCLAAAMDIHDMPERVVILSGGTDGNDGPTNAAGAIVDPFTIKRGDTAGISASGHLANNDSYHYLEKTGDLLITGPTNTNVMDVRVMLVR
ncbi:MAG: glycerate kinase [Deltaproteobacteria bacterium]|nr:glycerate kinase [Deltaproteobacteria bacterium]